MLLRVIFILIILLVGCEKSYSLPINFTIIHSSNVWGETEPCGWPKNPLGGLARKASIIDEETLKGNPVIVLDSGDLFFSKSTLYADKDNIDEAKIRAEIIVNCNNEMNHSAFSPGSRDFALGLAYLKKLKDQSNFNFTSCNLFHQNTSDRIFDSYAIENINGFKVGYIGAASSFQKDSILVKEPINEIKKIYNEISDKTDYIIVLFNGTASDLKRLDKSNIDIDLILRSKGSSRASEHGGAENILTYEAGNKGKYLNKIELSLTEINSEIVDLDLERKKVRQSTKHLKNKKKGDSNANLDELYKDNPKILNVINNHREIIKASNERLDSAKNTIKSHKIGLNTKIDSKPEILLIVDSGMSKIVKGPPQEDHKGRKPDDPHHGHDH